jgi:hypothetical protein
LVNVMQLMGMLPFPLLERISLSASLHHNVSDATLPLLCHPHVRRLVLVGDFSDRGLSDALCPRLAAVGDGEVSWEVRAFLSFGQAVSAHRHPSQTRMPTQLDKNFVPLYLY